ncbi:MAG: alpha/beta fold hydrolase [Rhizobacter sp.]
MKPAPQPQACYLGPAGEKVFAWFHAPADESAPGVGVVICNPFGFEEVCAHRSLRHLAAALAAAGLPVMRFDYAGCGDSEGDDFQPGRMAAWVRSIHVVADVLKKIGGVSEVCFVGLRLGAALATQAALQRDDVAGLVAMAPVLRGRAYLRELTMLGAVADEPLEDRAPSSLSPVLETAGFVLTRETLDALSALDLRRLVTAPAPRVLLVDRDDVPGVKAWVPDLESVGARVEIGRWPGYAVMMQDPQRSRVPLGIVDGVVGWLRKLPAVPITQPVEPASVASDTLDLPRGEQTLSEHVVRIDAGGGNLIGVLTGSLPMRSRPAVLMLNSGAVHHIGPNRLWVQLARRWALQGINVLRLDLSGIGDSEARPSEEENIVYSRHAGADIESALQYLKQHIGATECHAVGLCSGGYHALKAAMAGQGLASVLVVNPLTFNWKEGRTMEDLKDYEIAGLAAKFRRKLFTVEPWKRLLRNKIDLGIVAKVLMLRLWSFVYPPAMAIARSLHLPLKDDLARELALVARHNIRLKFVFAESAPGFDLLEREGGDAVHRMVRREEASLDFIPHADHTFTRFDARERLVALLDQRVLGECKPR